MAVTGPDLRAARETHGIGLNALAQAIGRNRGHLSRVERGEREPTPALVRDYERVLGTTIATSTPVGVAATLRADSTPIGVASLDDVRRRNLLGAVAAASVGAATPAPLLRLLDGLDTGIPAQVGLSDVEAVEAAAEMYMGLDLAHGGAMAAAAARSSLRTAVGLLDKRMTDPTRERLSSAIALLADRLGWAVYDTGDTANAAELLTFALDHAARGPDRDLKAHIMLDLSTVMTDAGHPTDGVDILRMALGDERISSAERANLHAVCARHCGTAGQTQDGLRHVGLSEDASTGSAPQDAPDWARRITLSPGHHDSALGLALFELGDHNRARQRLTSAVTRLNNGRTRTGLRCRTRLAILDMHDGNHTYAEASLQRITADATGVHSQRINRDLAMLRAAATRYGMPDPTTA